MTAALEGGEWSAARPDRTLPPGKTRRLGGPQGRSGRAENLVPTGIRSRTVQPVVSRYTDWATQPTQRHTHTHTAGGTTAFDIRNLKYVEVGFLSAAFTDTFQYSAPSKSRADIFLPPALPAAVIKKDGKLYGLWQYVAQLCGLWWTALRTANTGTLRYFWSRWKEICTNISYILPPERHLYLQYDSCALVFIWKLRSNNIFTIVHSFHTIKI